MMEMQPGQRWMSDAEPELGLGTIRSVDSRFVHIDFPASDVSRQYASESAPLKRVQFRTGDEIKTLSGDTFIVKDVQTQEGLLIYDSDDGSIPESEICHTLSFNTPEERLLGGHVDDFDSFDLRHDALKFQSSAKNSPVRGFLGGRVELIPHQFYIANEVTSRQIPRVLLADEVGLGKTIEACLILHRLLRSGQISRVLILLPPTLVHQWFVELIRRFNLSFHIFDRDYCESASSDGNNPFLDFQLGICSVDFLRDCPEWRTQALEAGWDMLIVDEAHHLGWSPRHVSPEYEIVEAFAAQTHGLLLLTATPEQLGLESHFARLRLLDPYLYASFEKFMGQKDGDYKQVALVCGKLLEGAVLSQSDYEMLDSMIAGDDEHGRGLVNSYRESKDLSVKPLLDYLLDRHGMGRVMFRNTRKNMTGFPKRRAHLIPLSTSGMSLEQHERLKQEFLSDTEIGQEAALEHYDYGDDKRLDWLIDFLKSHQGEKILLICRFKEKALALESALLSKYKIKVALFHEDLPLIKRDRHAAWFAEEDGASLLICSEIGSEGRNFQFSHHLILFDLPLDQELLEQRIGRLDRIGQKNEIHIHVPYFEKTPQEVLARWYREGLQAFEHNAVAGSFFDERYDRELKRVALDEGPESPAAENLIQETREEAARVKTRLEEGRDRLLEWNSYRGWDAEPVVNQIVEADQSRELPIFIEKMFDHFGVKAEALSREILLLKADHLYNDSFPMVDKDDGLQVTFDRKTALSREDVQFISWDHPMVEGALDLLLGSEEGNSAIALWPDAEDQTVLLEAIFVLECLAPPQMFVERFFSAKPIRVVVNQAMEDCTKEYSADEIKAHLKEGKYSGILDEPDALNALIKHMCETAKESAERKISEIAESAVQKMKTVLIDQAERLKSLKKINEHVRQEEIDRTLSEVEALETHIRASRIRLDSMRLIFKSPLA